MLNKISFDEIRKVIDAQILGLLSNAVQCEDEYLYKNAYIYIRSAVECTKTIFNLGAIDGEEYHNIICILWDYANNLNNMYN